MVVQSVASGALAERYECIRSLGLKLDMTRGKPCAEQLDLSVEMLRDVGVHALDGGDCRNYGVMEGLPEARTLFGEYLGVPAQNTFVLGSSSLAIMHDLVVQMLLRQLGGSSVRGTAPTMLSPVPGYDRHFAICEQYGIKLVPVRMNESGPDLAQVRELLQSSDSIVGMWCTPKYSNPTGITYSPDVCRELAQMTAPSGFRIFWDLAYQVHDLEDVGDELPNFFDMCRESGQEDRVFVIGSTSKMTFAGAGLAVLGASSRNLGWYRRSLAVQTIGPDKLTQLRHVRFLKSLQGIRAHMLRHRSIIKPKFDIVEEVLGRELIRGVHATWNRPRGGYFVSLYVQKGHAKRVVELAGQLGVKLTPAGAAFPGGIDPDDSHIRIAPTFPPLLEVRQAMEVVALCVRLSAEE